MTELIETDVLIIGCGVAGSTAALKLAEAGLAVTVATSAQVPSESNTYYAQGGIVYRGEHDSPELLKEDILRAGAGHCNPQAVTILAEEGPAALEEILLAKAGVQFDRTANGELSLAREGGHAIPRIVHTADATGQAIETALINALAHYPNVTMLTGHTAVDLLTPSHHALNRLAVYEPRSCVGAYLLNQAEGQVIRCLSKKTILATGGLGQIFLQTSNPVGSRGDGLAMANRAGAHIINAEFIQFHPTTLYHPAAPRFLISEAVRGAGARLVHADGEPFMQQYAPEWKDLAPRDIVARSIHQEILKRGIANVYLDLRSYISAQHIKEHFPTIYETCLKYDIDITRHLVPVVPAAHYFCGGVWVDAWGQTTLDHLYAVGEVACTGLHGANRLASTSLLEGVVWGRRSAQHILQTIPDTPKYNAMDIPPWREDSSELPDPALISQDMSYIKHTMWNYVGLVRTYHRMKRAISDLRNLENQIENFYRVSRLTDSLIGLRNAVRTAVIVAFSAWENKTSMGCHYRE
jgi:L-aspartate oxidase